MPRQMRLSPAQIAELRGRSKKQKKNNTNFVKSYGKGMMNAWGDFSDIAGNVKGLLSALSSPGYYDIKNLR